MVGWYDPSQLLKTGLQVLVSTVFARNADRRLTDAIASGTYGPFDYTTTADGHSRREIVVDFVADTGDGWNSTYAVAYWITRPHLVLVDGSGREHQVPRADILVFGGDEVYPAASAEGYERRLVAPYQTALEWTQPPHPDLFAIPGNHDWYDNLVAFERLFVAKEWFAGWQTRQERSYFALKLPHGWWLVGADVQLESDIDQPQVDFLRDVATRMGLEDRVVLCTAEPHWVYEHEFRHPEKYERGAKNLRFLEEKVFGNRIKVFLSGDLHHYRRHSLPDDSMHKITAGGGGAFLHPTHGMRKGALEGGFQLVKSYPTESESRRIAFWNLLFPLLNWKFGLLTGILSLVVYLNLAATLASWRPESHAPLLGTVAQAIPLNPGAVLVILIGLGGFLWFTDTSSRWYRIVGGLAHGSVQLGIPFLSACWVRAVTANCGPSWLRLIAPPVLQFALGWIAGSIVMGIYLFVSLNVFGRHRNEAFSSLRRQNYKNFLRLRIDEKGDLQIYPAGIRRVPRSWDAVQGATIHDAKLEPGAPAPGTPPQLIEGPIPVGHGRGTL